MSFERAREMINQVNSLDEIQRITNLSTEEVHNLILMSDLTAINKWWCGLVQGQRDVYLEDRWAMATAALRFGETGRWN